MKYQKCLTSLQTLAWEPSFVWIVFYISQPTQPKPFKQAIKTLPWLPSSLIKSVRGFMSYKWSKQRLRFNLYLYFAYKLSPSCLFVTEKTTKPIGPKFFVMPHMSLTKVY